MPGMFALINNKYKNGYLCLFQRIKDILIIENLIELKICSNIVNFEKGLYNVFKEKESGIRVYL